MANIIVSFREIFDLATNCGWNMKDATLEKAAKLAVHFPQYYVDESKFSSTCELLSTVENSATTLFQWLRQLTIDLAVAPTTASFRWPRSRTLAPPEKMISKLQCECAFCFISAKKPAPKVPLNDAASEQHPCAVTNVCTHVWCVHDTNTGTSTLVLSSSDPPKGEVMLPAIREFCALSLEQVALQPLPSAVTAASHSPRVQLPYSCAPSPLPRSHVATCVQDPWPRINYMDLWLWSSRFTRPVGEGLPRPRTHAEPILFVRATYRPQQLASLRGFVMLRYIGKCQCF